MSTITMFKKYADGVIRELTVTETRANVMTLSDNGFFLSEAEAKAGKVIEPKSKPAAKKKAAPKKKAK